MITSYIDETLRKSSKITYANLTARINVALVPVEAAQVRLFF